MTVRLDRGWLPVLATVTSRFIDAESGSTSVAPMVLTGAGDVVRA